MKKSYKYIAALLCAATAWACGENAVQKITEPLPGASVKFFNFGVNAPGVNFYANSAKITAIGTQSGAELNTGTTYPAAGVGGVGNADLYSGIAPGQYTLTGNIAAATDKGLAISKVATTLTDGKYYSYYQSGFYDPVAKTVDAFLVEDPFPAAFDFTVAYVRFVNASSNAQPMTLYAKNKTTGVEVPVGGAVAYKAAGTFTALPGAIYDLGARTTGSSTNAISLAGVTFLAGSVYTISALGDMTITSTTAANRPVLNQSVNR